MSLNATMSYIDSFTGSVFLEVPCTAGSSENYIFDRKKHAHENFCLFLQ